MRIHIERHARPRMTGTFREFACRNTRLMPYGNSPVPQIVRMKVRHASRLTGSGHRLIGGRFRDAGEQAALRDAILELAHRSCNLKRGTTA